MSGDTLGLTEMLSIADQVSWGHSKAALPTKSYVKAKGKWKKGNEIPLLFTRARIKSFMSKEHLCKGNDMLYRVSKQSVLECNGPTYCPWAKGHVL